MPPAAFPAGRSRSVITGQPKFKTDRCSLTRCGDGSMRLRAT
jgi:hypothetical protein